MEPRTMYTLGVMLGIILAKLIGTYDPNGQLLYLQETFTKS